MSDTDDLVARHNKLSAEQKRLEADVTMINSELSARKNALKRLMDEAKAEGFDPNNLEEEIRRRQEVAKVKLDTWESEIKDATKIIEPMLREVNNG